MKLAALRHLPRDARDTLFAVAVVAWILWPHAAHVPPWCVALSVLVLAWRSALAVAQRPLPPRWQVAAALALACGLTLWTERTLLGKEAGVTLLVALLALKTLELRARRDAMVLFFLGFVVVTTQFLQSQTLLVAVSMMVSVWGLMTALVLAHMPVGRPPLRQAAGIAARATAWGVPVMLVLFLLFPRIGPLWGLPQDAAGRTGLSGTLRLGSVAELASDDSVALRVRFPDGAPPAQALYFRGPVLTVFDGRDWSRQRLRASTPDPAAAAPAAEGRRLRYELTLEPHRLDTLPLLELTPAGAPGSLEVQGMPALQARLRPDAEWVADRPITDRLRIRAEAVPDQRPGPLRPGPWLGAHLQLPALGQPRLRAWARELRASPAMAGADGRALAQAVLAHIRTAGFTYTLEPGPYGREALDEFWLDRKLGFCEHFAASFVFIMRSLDVPARIVTGYQGSDPQPVDGYHVVRQSHAHAWAEIWVSGQGWLRVDPTAAVAPDRIQRSRQLAPTPGLVAQALSGVSPALAAQLRQAWEALNNRWNQFVLNYSSTRQFDLLRALGVSAPDWRDMARILALLLAAVALAGAGRALWERHREDPWRRLERRMRRRLAALGVQVGVHQGPRARAGAVRDALGPRGEALAQVLEWIDRERYGRGSALPLDRRWWPRFRDAARRAASS